MVEISENTDLFTIIVTADGDAETIPDVSAHAALGIRRFPEWSGYRGGALHQSRDGRRVVQYLQWASEEEYLACLQDPIWDGVPTAKAFREAVESGRVVLDVRSFEVLAASCA